ncbi:MAG TPA: hypothetical protein ENO24_06025 [Chloroflexi bacterium]|nr:hypothetical protein [Chloroflexota bacterium]
MQKIIDFGLDVKGYVDLVSREGVRGLAIPEEARECPFCPESHRLENHGRYGRFIDEGEWVYKAWILRLLCVIEGKTVSLLPSFLAPKKQATWKVIGTYFSKRHIEGLPQEAAMAAATKTNPSRQKGAYWDHCLEKNAARALGYLRPQRTQEGSLLPRLVHHLHQGFTTLGDALLVHNQRLHARFHVWLI